MIAFFFTIPMRMIPIIATMLRSVPVNIRARRAHPGGGQGGENGQGCT